MQLPIDVTKAPFKPKYVDEETHVLARWFIFGRYDDGTVGICDGDHDIFERVPKGMAERLIAARDAFCDAVMREIALDPNVPIKNQRLGKPFLKDKSE